MEEKIVIVLNEMSEYLSITQMKKLQEVIIKTFAENEALKVNIGLQYNIYYRVLRKMFGRLQLRKCGSIYQITRSVMIALM